MFLRGKAMLKSIIDLIISVSCLQADLGVCVVGIKEEGLNA
jgi:hypothetical protein